MECVQYREKKLEIRKEKEKAQGERIHRERMESLVDQAWERNR
jgi:hypothetical protein